MVRGKKAGLVHPPLSLFDSAINWFYAGALFVTLAEGMIVVMSRVWFSFWFYAPIYLLLFIIAGWAMGFFVGGFRVRIRED